MKSSAEAVKNFEGEPALEVSKKQLPGLVLEGYGSSYTVLHRNALFSCGLRGKFRQTLRDYHNPVAVGDRVKFTQLNKNSGVIDELLPRRNKISRSTKWGQLKERIIAVNVDQIIAVVSTKDPPLKTGLIDRMLMVAERERLRGVLCINKIDLIKIKDISTEVRTYSKLRYTAHCMSALMGEGVDELRSLLAGKFSVFIGQSGVGKSTILNALQPGLNQKVREISEFSKKGKHTTAYVTAVQCDFGALIADTPGFRDFGIWGIKQEEAGSLYREFRQYAGRCKFQPCFHVHEPKCAVKEACERGKIAPFRYSNYVRIYESLDS